MENKIKHFIHYFLSAGSGVILDWIIWLILHAITGNPILSQCVSKTCSAILGFILYKKVFSHKKSPIIKFSLAVIWSWIVSIILLKIFSNYINIYVAKILTDGITFIMNYVIMKVIVFKNKK